MIDWTKLFIQTMVILIGVSWWIFMCCTSFGSFLMWNSYMIWQKHTILSYLIIKSSWVIFVVVKSKSIREMTSKTTIIHPHDVSLLVTPVFDKLISKLFCTPCFLVVDLVVNSSSWESSSPRVLHDVLNLHRSSTNGFTMKANRSERWNVEDSPAVEDISRLVHWPVNSLEVQESELRPFCTNDEGMSSSTCLILVVTEYYTVLTNGRMIQISSHLWLRDFRIIDPQKSTVRQECLRDMNRRRASSVSSVCFEGKAKDGDFLSSNSIEKRFDDLLTEPRLRVVVHFEYCTEVRSYLIESKSFW